MKPLQTYFLYLLLLTLLTLGLNILVVQIFGGRIWDMVMLSKTYIVTDTIACLSLLLLYIKSVQRSTSLKVVIGASCGILVSLFGFVGVFAKIWYSNIPDEVMMFMQLGRPLCFAKIIAAGITSTIIILVIRKNNTLRSKKITSFKYL